MASLRRICLRIAFVIVCLLSPGVGDARGDEPFRAGFAETDITPEPGMEKPGGYHKSFMHKTQDACKVRAAVFDDGKTRVALVGVDALAVPRALVKEVREEIQAACGIAPAAVLIGASHSHTSGPVGLVQPGEYDQASEFVQENGLRTDFVRGPGVSRHGEKRNRQSGLPGRRVSRCGNMWRGKRT